MASGGIRKKSGSVLGTAASLSIRTCDFRPNHVIVRNVTSGICLEWTDTMADASGVKTAAAGDRTFVTTNGITPLSNGFTLGTDTVNGSAEVLQWTASE